MAHPSSGSGRTGFRQVALSLGIVAAAVIGQPVLADPSSEKVLVSNIGGPEGPLFVGHDLYYVGWTDNVLARWNGGHVSILNHDAQCVHNGLAQIDASHLLIACLADSGAVLEVTLDGKEVRRWTADRDGRPFVGGINDFAVTRDGGVYATLSGPLTEPPGLIAGKVFYLAPGKQEWQEVASDLNYANGIALSPDNRTLYVAESIGNSIIKFAVQPDGTLSQRSNFALLHVLTPDKFRTAFIGPDGIKVDHAGNLYVAQYGGGKIIKINPKGELLGVLDVSAGDGVTNIVLTPDESKIIVTVVRDLSDPKSLGSVVEIPNSLR